MPDNVLTPYTRLDPIYRLTPVGTTFAVAVTFTWHNVADTTGAYWWTGASGARNFARVTPTVAGSDVTISNTHFSCVAHTDNRGADTAPPGADGVCAEAP